LLRYTAELEERLAIYAASLNLPNLEATGLANGEEPQAALLLFVGGRPSRVKY
jgi:hypothetical protein